MSNHTQLRAQASHQKINCCSQERLPPSSAWPFRVGLSSYKVCLFRHLGLTSLGGFPDWAPSDRIQQITETPPKLDQSLTRARPGLASCFHSRWAVFSAERKLANMHLRQHVHKCYVVLPAFAQLFLHMNNTIPADFIRQFA